MAAIASNGANQTNNHAATVLTVSSGFTVTANNSPWPLVRKYPNKAAAKTISGNGAARKKIATNETAAMAQCSGSFSARFEIRSSASMTMTNTAALMPRNSASTSGTLPKYA